MPPTGQASGWFVELVGSSLFVGKCGLALGKNIGESASSQDGFKTLMDDDIAGHALSWDLRLQLKIFQPSQ